MFNLKLMDHVAKNNTNECGLFQIYEHNLNVMRFHNVFLYDLVAEVLGWRLMNKQQELCCINNVYRIWIPES